MKRRSRRANFLIGILTGLIVGLVAGFALKNVFIFLLLGVFLSIGVGTVIVFDPTKTMHP